MSTVALQQTLPRPSAFMNAVSCTVPNHDVHREFIEWAEQQLAEERERRLFRRMAERSGIEHRWSVIARTKDGGSPVEPTGFYAGPMPSTSARMAVYAEAAPKLALAA